MDTGEKDEKQQDLRRSSRINFGEPPSRFGNPLGPSSSFFTSTQVQAADGTPMKRTTLAVPLSAVIKKTTEDGNSISSHGSGHSLVDLLDEEIANLEKTVNSKIDLLQSLVKMRNEQKEAAEAEIQADQKLSDNEYDDAEAEEKRMAMEFMKVDLIFSEDEKEENREEEEQFHLKYTPPSAINAGTRGHYFETPLNPSYGMGRRSPARPKDPPPPPPKFGGAMKKEIVADPTDKGDARKKSVGMFGGNWNPSQAKKGGFPEERHEAASGRRRMFGGGNSTFGGRTGTGSRRRTLPARPSTSVDDLAGALINALQLQNQRTEQFVARQSSSSSLPQFSGNPLEWPLFAHHFIQSTQDCGFSPQQNMTRLEKALRGEARSTVRSLMIVPTNTQTVMQRLEQRFGRPEIVIQSLVEMARKTPSLKEGKLSSILDYSNAVNNLVTTVETLQEPSYLENPQLLQELVDKLPDMFKIQWGMAAMKSGRRGNLKKFAKWIDTMSDAASMVTVPKVSFRESKREENLHAAAEEPTPQSRPPRSCHCCGKEGHNVIDCDQFKKKPLQERRDLVKQKNLCFRCLRSGHSVKICRSKATCNKDGCGRRHHTLLHDPEQGSKKEAKEEVKIKDLNATMESLSSSTLLRILCVTLYGPAGKLTVNALLDEGSTVTLMSADVAKELGLSGGVDPLRIKWTNGTSQEDHSSRKVDCFIGPVGVKEKFKMKRIRTVRNLALPNQRTDLEDVIKKYPHLQKTKFKYLPGEKPVILIGQPHIKLTVARQVIEDDDDSPILTNTKLGWVMHGPSREDGGEEATFSCIHESDDDLLHNLVKESFSLENLGVTPLAAARSREDKLAEEKMKLVTRKVDGRWETGLLWRREPVILPSSRAVAEKRLRSIERKLARNDDIQKQYHERIHHYLEKGYARKLSAEELAVKSDVEWFLPHFDTRHLNKPGKIRIVFDAASRSNGVSLNDYLLTGPDLLVSLPGILVKFRQKKIAISGDITEMFHQVRIRKEDCPAQRFLWREAGEEEASVFQLEVMMFGSVCSPYCAQFAKNANAIEYQLEFPEAVEAITKFHYMDDWLQSVDTEQEAIKLVRDVTEVHKRGGMEIGKWISNSKKLLEEIIGNTEPLQTKNLAEWSEVPTERALGLHWIPEEDSFTFRVNLKRAGEGISTGERTPTKREVLRLIMLVWDPLGFIGHYLVKAKIVMQEIWKSKIGWDDEIPSSMLKKWTKWIKQLPQLADIRIPRCYSPICGIAKHVSLHIFSDSSEVAGSCLSYLRIVDENDEVKVSFIMSRSRVAPVKPCSIPRLELNAALLSSRMGKFILSELEIKVHKVYYWTDSMTVLRWIRSEARRFNTFVAGRVGEIQENSDVSQWNWVPTAENPADDGTREGKTDLTPESRWWTGPAFLWKETNFWPVETTLAKIEEEDFELRKQFVAVIVEVPNFSLPDLRRFSKFLRIVRATAWMLKFIQIKLKKTSGVLLDTDKAKLLLYRRSQWESWPEEMQRLSDGRGIPKSSALFTLSPVLDGKGVLRMKSRLTGADENLKFPIILHPRNGLTVLLIRHFHEKFGHAGEDLIRNELRQTFWIPNLRAAVRKVNRACIICRKKRIQPQPPEMGALPDFRIQPQPRAFWICGMDYFGPMEVTIGRRHEKRYGVLFTCMNTRAVHLEIAHSLTTDSCVMAIRRMISRRGQPSQIFSDNGTNLRGAEKELRKALLELDQEKLKSECSSKSITWNFIPPAAAHMGGSWERLVRSVKTALSVILKSRAPKEEVLETVFAEAEAIVNSRPLTDVPVDMESPEALTPFHFLIGTSSTNRPPGKFEEKEICLRRQWRIAQALSDQFWKRWVREYLPTLQRRAKWHGSRPSLEMGDIVVVLDESLKRNTWPLGVITHVFPGADGVVRVAEVKTATGVYRRPVTKLGKLDVRKAEPQD